MSQGIHHTGMEEVSDASWRNRPSRGLAWVGLALLVSLASGTFISWIILSQAEKSTRAAARVLSIELAANIEVEIRHTLSVLDLMATMVRQSNGNPDQFQTLAPHFFPNYPAILDLEMQKDGIISDVYPMEGNESALGINLFESDANVPLLEKIRLSGELIVQGPLRLFQLDEEGLIARMPVYLAKEDHPRAFWGFVTAIIRFHKFIEIAGFNNAPIRGYHYELRRNEAAAGEAEVIARSSNTLLHDTIDREINFSGGDWTLHIKPVHGWQNAGLILLCTATTLIFSGLTTALMNFSMRARRAAFDLRFREMGIRKLHEMTSNPNSLEDAVQKCLDLGCQMFDCELGVLAKLEEGRFYVKCARAPQEIQPCVGAGLELENPCFKDALKTHSAVYISGTNQAVTFDVGDQAKALNIQTYYATPVPKHDRTFGVLGFLDRQAQKEPPPEIKKTMLAVMGNWVGTVLDQSEDRKSLIAARDEAEAANNAKSMFISRMSHELRTPLNGIMGFAYLMTDKNFQDDPHEYGEKIHASGAHLLHLIDELLDLAKIENGTVSLDLVSVNVPELIDEVLALLQPVAKKRDILLNRKKSAMHEKICVHADGGKLRQVLLNLASNAIKYNCQGGSVTFSVEHQENENMAYVHVQDTGIGMDSESMKRLFRPFDRLGVERTQPEVEGTGLGLVVSKNLTEAMGGTIEVHSIKNKGSTFTVKLPLDASPSKYPRDKNEAEPLSTKGLVHQNDQPDTFKVLYVEDEAYNRLLMTEIIHKKRPQLKLLMATNGKEGLQTALDQKPGVILLDYNLPDYNGDQMMEHLMNHHETRNIPVYVISADARPELISRMNQLGIAGYMTKPVHVGQLLQAIDKHLGH